MAGYVTTADLLEDLLFRAGELFDGTSDFQAQALRYLNRSQEALCLGGAEFEPTIQEDWWWLRKSPPGVLTLDPIYTAGLVTVTEGSPTVSFTVPPLVSVKNWVIAVNDHPDMFRVAAHTAASALATLDSPYTGADGTFSFWLMHQEYDLATDVMRLLTVSLNQQLHGAPISAQIVDQNTIRFDWADPIADNTESMRVEYEYLFRPATLMNTEGEQPTVPLEWRRLIPDGALFFLFHDKNDNRVGGMGALLSNGLKAMARENHHKNAVQNAEFGRLRPRQDDAGWLVGEFQVLRP